MDRSPDNLIWIDLEFTTQDPRSGFISQAAMIVTSADLSPISPPGIPPEVGGLLYDVQITAEQAAGASEWVRQHQKEQLKRSQSEAAWPVEKVEEVFLGYLLATCEVSDEKATRPLLAGNSVHGDKAYLQQHMPRLAELLSFRILDVTSLKELARRWCPTLQFNKNGGTIGRWFPGDTKLKGGAHDALYDIKGSLAELNFYRHHLFVNSARQQASAAQ